MRISRFVFGFFAVVVMVGGCSDESPLEPAIETDPVLFWLGTTEDSGSGLAGTSAMTEGLVAVDLVRRGDAFSGTFVYEITDQSSRLIAFVRGSLNGRELTLEFDTDIGPRAGTLAFSATVSENSLSGFFNHNDRRILFTANQINRGTATLIGEWEHPDPRQSISSVESHGGNLWVGENFGYLVLDKDWNEVDWFRVFWPESAASWTAWYITSAGANLWGTLSGGVSHGDEPTTPVTFFAEFTRDGVVRRFYEEHIGWGVAHDGTDLWSLAIKPYRLETVFAERPKQIVPLNIPNVARLTYDGTAFWTADLNFGRAYRIPVDGSEVTVFDLPVRGGALKGLTMDGDHLVYADAGGDGRDRIYRFSLEGAE